jgi:enoyl-CoA hydratase
VVVLQGAERNFSAGYDLSAAMSELGGGEPENSRAYVEVGNETCWTAWRLRKPVIAAVQGYCLGGAFELAMACDFVLASREAKFGEPEIRFSDAPPFLISPWVMGMRQAKDLLLTGEVIDAEKAFRFGILTDLLAEDELAGAVRTLADKLCGFAVENWHLNKAAVNRSYEIMGFEAAIDMGTEAFVATNTTPNALKTEFAERLERDGFAAAVKWVQARYSGRSEGK